MDLLRLLNDGGVNGGVNGGASSKGGGVNLEELIFETIQKNPGINAPAIAEILQKRCRAQLTKCPGSSKLNGKLTFMVKITAVR